MNVSGQTREMKAERLCLDIINTLPSNIIENILCLLPIKDAARTSILSRNWRYNWLTIPKLVFIGKDFEVTTDANQRFVMEDSTSQREKMSKRFKMLYAIYQILLVHHGPIQEFTLSMDADDTCFEIDHIILHLTRNYTVKKFKLDLTFRFGYRVPTYIFSSHQLTDLYLRDCDLHHDPTKFNEFCSLKTLYLDRVYTTTETLVHLIYNSPLLKSITLILFNEDLLASGSTIFDLFNCLRVVENVTICHWVIQCFAFDELSREIPPPLVHLKYLCVRDIHFRNKYGFPFLLVLMRCCPNLEKIKLQQRVGYPKKSDIDFIPLQSYSDIWLKHLNELVIENFDNMKPEMKFVKIIFAKSPVLEKVRIVLSDKVANDEELKMLKVLLCFPRASPLVDIIVKSHALE